jgi:broad specificity phosphatase PhoE
MNPGIFKGVLQMQMTNTSFYFIRHGETDWNRENRIMGGADIPLNGTGRLQAKRAATRLKDLNIQSICHSPLKRAKETAVILNEMLHCPLIEVDFLKECSWGTFEGELKWNKQYLEQWINGITPEGAETCEAFKERAMEGVKLSLVHPCPLIVSHGGIYWAIQQLLCKNNSYKRAENCFPYYFSPTEKNEWISNSLEPSFDEEPFET